MPSIEWIEWKCVGDFLPNENFLSTVTVFIFSVGTQLYILHIYVGNYCPPGRYTIYHCFEKVKILVFGCCNNQTVVILADGDV